jgi:hypothetical protein
MKKHFFSLATFLTVALACVSFVSCGSDDDGDGGGGGSKGSLSFNINGTGYSFTHAYWIADSDGGEPDVQIAFYDVDMEKYASSGKQPETLSSCAVILNNITANGELPTGTFDDFWVAISKNEQRQTSSDGHAIYGVSYYGSSFNTPAARVTVSKSGGNYTVKVSGLDIYSEEGHNAPKVAENVSFSYTGGIADMAALMRKYGMPMDN